MDVSDLLNSLNSAQREAVCVPAGHHALILAGAGSGKTRVLVHRIAWLIRTGVASPYGVLAVTFTNKAASEMRGRIESLLGMPSSGMWVGTFHGIAHRLLRAHYQEAGLPQGFQILDSDDQYRLIRRVLREFDLDEKQWPPRQMQGFINSHKDRGERPDHIKVHLGDLFQEVALKVYRHYEEICRRSGSVDFAELLLRAFELFQKHPDVLAHYQRRFSHLLIDEFQDTNTIQYAWIKLLAGERGELFAVGDDDQSIYGWRGAQIENIHQYQRDFANVELIRLEQNYRSTGNILKAANALIARNSDRLGKNLWTEGGDGEPIKLYGAFNELEEARYIVEQIEGWIAGGHARSEVAILYRSNAQSRVLEEALLYRSIPYRIYGGMRFFERAEIRDALAYLRLSLNRDDDPSFERVISTPPRGIGARTVDTIRELARERAISLWRAAEELVEHQGLTARAANAVSGFLQLIEQMAGDDIAAVGTAEHNRDGGMLQLHERIDSVVQLSGLIDYFKKEKGEKGQARVENLEELVSAGRQFEFDEDEGFDELGAFLAHAALEAGEGQADEWEDCVQMMTLHSAKGLEFPLVFMSGLEEGLFPHQRSLDEPGRLEEERRLCYVGMTRARERLVISYAEVRRLYGQEKYTRPSRFVSEIPAEFIDEMRIRGQVSQPLYRAPEVEQGAEATQFFLGQRLFHAKFGEGTLLDYEGSGAQARVQVKFDRVGTKWLVLAYAKLEGVA
jgi:DNA helicase-2/ATP-dependent DNA helicase PcrA